MSLFIKKEKTLQEISFAGIIFADKERVSG
jgi:hypothetical protein